MTDREKLLDVTADSLRNVTSIRDFLIAVETGAKIAIGMLDKTEDRLIQALEQIDQDYGG